MPIKDIITTLRTYGSRTTETPLYITMSLLPIAYRLRITFTNCVKAHVHAAVALYRHVKVKVNLFT